MLKHLLTTTALVSIGLAAQAETDKCAHGISLGIDMIHYGYKEPKSFSFLGMKQKGYLAGFVFNYSFSLEKYIVQAQSRLLYGKTKYTGHILQTGKSYEQKNIPNWLSETRILGGPKLFLGETKFMPMIGLGFRYKSDHASDPGYTRESNYWYVPVGLSVEYALTSNWTLRGHIEYDYLLWGTQYSHGTTAIKKAYKAAHGKSLAPLQNKQKSGYGLKIEGSASNNIGKGTLSVGPYINYWNIKDSDENTKHAGYIFREPKNNTLECGLKISYTF